MRTLYGYFRSSATYRVRIALNIKQIVYEDVHIHLIKSGGEQFLETYKKLNPMSLVPAYVDDENGWNCFTQSLAIIEYFEELYPKPALLPQNPQDRAWVRSIAQTIACDIHPLNNLRVLKYLSNEFNISEDQKNTWYQHWIAEGFSALETQLQNHTSKGDFCHGNTPTIADLCLVPQVYNAIRYKCDLSAYPTILKICKNCDKLPAFVKAFPKDPDQ